MKPKALTRRSLLATVALGTLASIPAAGFAQASYPDRPIRIIVPFAAGGAVDVMARIFAEKLSDSWKQPVIVENRVGASGNIGAEVVARAEPDGYTLLISPPGPIAINQHLFANLRFDPAAFVPITIIAGAPNILVARPGLVASVPELIALARSQPGKLTYGSPGKGSTPHLSAEMLRSLAGLEMAHVPYKSVPDALKDVVSGHIDLSFGTLIDSLALIQSGRLQALGVGGTARSPLLSDVPTISETLPGFVSTAWYGAVAPPKTPPQIVEKLSGAVSKVLRESEAMARLQALQSTPILNSPTEASVFIAVESERWRKVVAAAGMKPE
jgi:tripartite-type tricarboxylate transporter receptor subunit TctC